MNYKLISTHLRVMTNDTGSVTQCTGLYLSIDGTEGTPYFISRDPDSERMWISKESAAEMLREEDAVLASRVPMKIIIDLLGDG